MKTKQELFMEEFRKEVRKEKIRQAKLKEQDFENYLYSAIKKMKNTRKNRPKRF